MSIIKISKENFENEVMKSNIPVLIDFWADWCGPCRMIGPTIDEISSENNNIKVCKVNVDDEPEISSAFNVVSIPSLAIVKNGKLVKFDVGVKSKQDILKMLD